MEENSIPRKPIHIGIIISRDLWDDKDINVILTYNHKLNHKLKYFFSEQYMKTEFVSVRFNIYRAI